ncbi:holo-ACP synthase [Aquisalibacillus elongatus]|uniref:Holo-[acyl-carrier-protein] synthase n=1 Tax=Aquisalibacillus elongatus TaxID=485577 RepID=A0A3N5BPV7_9BACI|nr:holo-ACP synthase [Aquisalibacillus elongatus]RPF57090.1 holo-[acyl-carrier-protein] synthase [Aquisalibacillus elongatus]
MIVGNGIDLIELERIENLILHKGKFAKRVLSPKEYGRFEQYSNLKRRIEFLAGRFAAKEAYSKAIGTGIGKHISFHSIEIFTDNFGKPQLYINGEAQQKTHVSISHSRDYAIAQVIIEK